MFVECEDAIYKTGFVHAQLEITGSCNMKCAHCRATNEKPVFMSLEKIGLILDFADQNKNEEFNLTVSGGEPFLHPRFVEIMELIRSHNFGEVVVTTNGSLLKPETLARLDALAFPNLTIQVSLDSTDPAVHDLNRGYPGAFEKAVKGLAAMKDYPNLRSSVRMTVTYKTLDQIEDMVRLLIGLGVIRLGVGSVIPVGKGAEGDQTMTPELKRSFLEGLAQLARKYAGEIEIVTEDPLKCLVAGNPWISPEVYDREEEEGVFGGCTAGIDCFNVDTSDQVTPCSVFREAMFTIEPGDSPASLREKYENSSLVKSLFQRRFGGKCAVCSHRRICGGCRATAKHFGGSYFAGDGTCWL